MEKIKIKLLFIGYQKHPINTNYLLKWQSKIFLINNINEMLEISIEKIDAPYYIPFLKDEDARKIIKKEENVDITVGITTAKLENNFYLRILSDNTCIISLYTIDYILLFHDIALEHFIIKNIYELTVIYKCFKKVLSTSAYNLAHINTRGCLFDLNGQKDDVIYNTENIKLCNECKTRISKCDIEKNFIHILEKEIKKIKKPFYKRLYLFVKEHIIISLITTIIVSLILNILANWISIKLFGN